ncbi:hypothetical protein LA345_12890 [Burkholderia vietnamiensis]|uniref:Uncharacterized protein n=1 Tax=Burkholderia vietnamiensis (strain G4 / LMG 22486) TaxID=269482 RepID=A4JFJ5_BURVG|nr:hypothetical protein Bcep1808_2046 [Burkholderia vietnamiensis G4]MCB4344808.1 hypothetical protein [Burkholderia vietnamiensis]
MNPTPQHETAPIPLATAPSRPSRADAPLRSSTVIFGHRSTPTGREPWIGRLTHDADLSFSLMILASGVIGETIERERNMASGDSRGLDPEALAQRIIRESEGVFEFDRVFPKGGEPAIFRTDLTIHHFASPSHEPIVRLHAIDCDRSTVHVFGGGTRLFLGSSAFQLVFGPVAPECGLDPRLERESLAYAQQATKALTQADWQINRRSPELDTAMRDARQIALPTFEWRSAFLLAERRNLTMCIANLAPLGTVTKGVVISRGDFYVVQQDRSSGRVWLHDRTELDGHAPEVGDQLAIAYESVPGPSSRANPVRGRVRLLGPAPERREPIVDHAVPSAAPHSLVAR